jgi:hypothetical protein
MLYLQTRVLFFLLFLRADVENLISSPTARKLICVYKWNFVLNLKETCLLLATGTTGNVYNYENSLHSTLTTVTIKLSRSHKKIIVHVCNWPGCLRPSPRLLRPLSPTVHITWDWPPAGGSRVILGWTSQISSARRMQSAAVSLSCHMSG